eukprot:g41188.t1
MPEHYGKFSMINPPNLRIFGLWEVTGAPGGNPHRHRENVKHNTDSRLRAESNLGPWRCEDKKNVRTEFRKRDCEELAQFDIGNGE